MNVVHFLFTSIFFTEFNESHSCMDDGLLIIGWIWKNVKWKRKHESTGQRLIFSIFQFISKNGNCQSFSNYNAKLNNISATKEYTLYTCRYNCCLFVPINKYCSEFTQLRHLHRRNIHSFYMFVVVHSLIVMDD